MNDVTILKVFLLYLSELKLNLLASKSPSLRNAVMWQKHYGVSVEGKVMVSA